MNKAGITLLLFILSFTTNAQRINVYGFLRDSLTHFPINNGIITNSSINKKVKTGADGLFKLEIAPGDYIFAYAPSYMHDTLLYSYINTDTITIFLTPSGNVLPTVTVTSNLSKYQLDSIRRRTYFEEGRGSNIKTVSKANNEGFGIGINLDRFFKRKDKYRKSSERTMKNIEKDAYVNYRFSPHIVAYYTRLKGDRLQRFINKYNPGYEWLRQHPTNEDVLYYINEKLKLESKQ